MVPPVVRTKTVAPTRDVAVETKDLIAGWIAGTTELMIDPLIAFLATVGPPAIIDVVKREKCVQILAAARARWRRATVRVKNGGAHFATSPCSRISRQTALAAPM